MKLAFYMGQGTLINRLIRLVTKGPCSHCELVFPDEATTVPGVTPMAHDPHPPASLCFSASSRDGGVRFKWINLADGQWELVDVPVEQFHACAAFAQTLAGKKYDWLGVLGFAVPWLKDDQDDRFCSEVCVEVLQRASGFFPGVVASRISPQQLYVLSKAIARSGGFPS